MTILKKSRYAKSTVYLIDGKYSIGGRTISKQTKYDDNITHICVDGAKRPDIIAHLYWGKPELFYIVCDWNDIFDPIEDIEIGTKLIIPSNKTIVQEGL